MALSRSSQGQKHIVRFRRKLTNDEVDELHTSISSLEGINSIDLDTSQMTIAYEFPLLEFGTIWQLMKTSLDKSAFSLYQTLRYSLLGYAEQNERDHLLYPCHWYTYVEDVYIHYFDYDKKSKNVRKQLWRRYKKIPGHKTDRN